MSQKSKENFLREVEALWDRYMNLGESSEAKVESKKAKPFEVDIEDLSFGRISRCNVAELKALCKAKSLKVSGKKEDLVQRLLDYTKGGESSIKVEKKVSKPVGPTKVLSKISAKPLIVTIRKNSHGRLEHPPTGIVFDDKNTTAIGVQESNGSVRSLSDEDIETCKKYKFTYSVPNNLDESKMKLPSQETVNRTGDTRSKVEKMIELGPDEDLIDPEEEVSDVESEEELIED